MAIVEITYAAFHERLATYLDRVSNRREVLLVKRRGRPNVAIIAANELAEMAKTAPLQGSPKIARPLLKSSQNMESGGVRG